MTTTFTLAFALVLGVAVSRVLTQESHEILIDTRYVSAWEVAPKSEEIVSQIEAPEMEFKTIVVSAPKPVKKKIVTSQVERTITLKNDQTLPFHEPVTLSPVKYEGELLEDLVALYQDLPIEEKVMVAEAPVQVSIVDEVKTAQASTKEAEPEFFEYPQDEVKDTPVAEEVAAVNTSVPAAVQMLQPEPVKKEPESPAQTETETNIIAFDYSGMSADIKAQRHPQVTWVDTQKKKKNKFQPTPPGPSPEPSPDPTTKSLVFESQMTIQGVATDLKKSSPVQGFEVRFQDNSSETFEDYGDGEVTVTQTIAQNKMTRSMVLLKRGFAPTNTDLLLEDGAGAVSLPVLSQETLDQLLENYEKTGPVGALLVELDDATDKATVDVPFGEVITLDGDLRETEAENFRYQLFVGIKAGNALLSFHTGKEITHKIVHVHERELTFDANEFERENISTVSLYQEDLLSREKSPLVAASGDVRVFAKNVSGMKLKQNTFRLDFGSRSLGARNYLELNHEQEPIFVGTRNEKDISVPSESFMRHILGSLPEKSLGNRCLIQVNLKKEISGAEVGTESVGQALMAEVQYLDADGKFYDSPSEKTRKIIIFGENQGSSGDAGSKVNLKVLYQDGSHDYLGTFCSANTYLVEQL